MSRFKNNLYTIERRVWKNHELCLIQNEDFTLFSGHHRTKIVEEDLPEWYVFGRYYKMWGFLSTKGITDLRYVPNLWINHFLKDDCLLISYGGQIEEKTDDRDFDMYSGVDERVWGNEILYVLKGAEKFSGYDITHIVEQIREKKRILMKNYPDEFGSHTFNWWGHPRFWGKRVPAPVTEFCHTVPARVAKFLWWARCRPAPIRPTQRLTGPNGAVFSAFRETAFSLSTVL